jgi:outer membrane receptor for monomeric catechols
LVPAAPTAAPAETIYTLDPSLVTAETQRVSQACTPMKIGAALLEKPAAVRIATKDLLAAQGATSLQDALRNGSGLMHEGGHCGVGGALGQLLGGRPGEPRHAGVTACV